MATMHRVSSAPVRSGYRAEHNPSDEQLLEVVARYTNEASTESIQLRLKNMGMTVNLIWIGQRMVELERQGRVRRRKYVSMARIFWSVVHG